MHAPTTRRNDTTRHGTTTGGGENPTNPDPRTREAPDLANAVALPVAVPKPQLQFHRHVIGAV